MNEFGLIREGLRGIMAKYAVKIGDFTLRSGKKSNFYVDCRPLLLDPYCLEVAGSLMRRHCYNGSVAGTGLGGTLLVGAVMAASNGEISGIHIRSEQKDHGTKRKVEYGYDNGYGPLITIVDDVLTTGSSISFCIDALQEEKFSPVKVVVLVDREDGGKETIEKKYDISVTSIFKKSDFI